MLDEIDVLRREELNEIEGYLLEKLIHESEHTILITVGRSFPLFNSFALRRPYFLLSAFDEKTVGNQLDKLKPGLSPIASKVLELGNGIPGNTTKLAKYVVDEPLSIQNELEAVQSLLADVKDGIEKRFHPIIETICVLQAFFHEDVDPLARNHPALGESWDEIRLRELFGELRQVQIGPGGLMNWDREKKGWVMDEPTRALFEKELQMRDPELWKQLHCTAYRMYKQWGNRYNSQLYKDKAEYHWQRLQSAGFACDDVDVRIEP
jgi:hypothetical protein